MESSDLERKDTTSDVPRSLGGIAWSSPPVAPVAHLYPCWFIHPFLLSTPEKVGHYVPGTKLRACPKSMRLRMAPEKGYARHELKIVSEFSAQRKPASTTALCNRTAAAETSKHAARKIYDTDKKSRFIYYLPCVFRHAMILYGRKFLSCNVRP